MMWKHWVIFALGIIVLILPFLGFPPRVDTAFLFIFGGVIAILSYMNARAYFLRNPTTPAQEKEPLPVGTEVRSMNVMETIESHESR